MNLCMRVWRWRGVEGGAMARVRERLRLGVGVNAGVNAQQGGCGRGCECW